LLPILTEFAQRHEVSDMVVVADAGMLSAANLNGIADAGFNFIVGSRISTAPYDLAAHLERHGNAFDDSPRFVEGHGRREGHPEQAGDLPVQVRAPQA
jgi:hypothetical protein